MEPIERYGYDVLTADYNYQVRASKKIQRQYQKHAIYTGVHEIEKDGELLFNTREECDLFESLFTRKYYGTKMSNFHTRMVVPYNNNEASKVDREIKRLVVEYERSHVCYSNFWDCPHRSKEAFDYLYKLLKNAPSM
jgi:hypothetical protein